MVRMHKRIERTYGIEHACNAGPWDHVLKDPMKRPNLGDADADGLKTQVGLDIN